MSTNNHDHVVLNMTNLNNGQGHHNDDHRIHAGSTIHNGANEHVRVTSSHLVTNGARDRRLRSRSPPRLKRQVDTIDNDQQNRSARDLASAATDAEPLLETTDDAEIIPKERPPIAHPENDDDDEIDVHNNIPNTPDAHPGVDDGFFPHDHDNPDIFLGPRIGEDDIGSGKGIPLPPTLNGIPPRRNSGGSNFPYSPGYNPNVFINADGDTQSIPDVNVYQHKKTLAQGMMDLALLSANANQLRYVLESYDRHPYYYPSLIFISMSIILQIAVGVGLIWNSRYNVKNHEQICIADRINNFTVLGIFMITIVNVFISSFGVADAPRPLPELQG